MYARPDGSGPSHDTVASENGRPAAGEFSALGNTEIVDNEGNKVKIKNSPGQNDGTLFQSEEQNDQLKAKEKLQAESQAWAQKIDNLEQKPNQDVLMLKQTPLAMHLVGADFKALFATPHLFDRLFVGKDGSQSTFGKEEFKQLPVALADPVAVFDQENGRKLFLIDLQTKSGAPILVPVEFNAKKDFATVNLAVTAFAKEKDGKPKIGWVKTYADNLVYVNKKKISSLDTSAGANSLGVLLTRNTDSVRTEKDLVNLQSQYPGYYQNQSGPRGAYSPSQRLITLFQSADPSTFIHESGHFFLDVMTDLANRPDAPQQLRQDMKILMSWFGVKSLDVWNAMTLDEKREYHEKFARGFERYMREGKAPSIKLMRVFHSFMNWLKGVYSSIRQLNVDLTPEVREVMDRMLATDKEIRTAKAVMGLANTYITRDQFPGTDEEWHEWEEKIKDEDDYARARLTAQVLGERAFLEKKTAEYQAKYADEDKAREDAYSLHYKEALDKHREEPIYKMRKRMLEDKEDGKPIYPIARADVDFLPKEQIEELDRLGILSDDGYPLDVLSRQFGYDNETAFITDLINVASTPIEMAAKQDAERAVREEFGDRMTPDKVRELAKKSALNDLTLERLSREIALLNSGKRDPIVLQAAKAWADEEISKTKIKDLKPGLYSQAMRKYQRAYERALAKGDIEAAKEAKKNQLFNAAAMKAVTEAQDRVNAVVKDVKRMGIRYRKVLRKEQDAGFLDQILYLAGLYQIRDEHTPRESFSSFAESMEEKGFPMGLINSSIFEATNAKDYQDMTVDEFTELDTALSVLSFHGMNLRKRVLAEQKAKTESWVQSIIKDIVPGKKANKSEKVEPNSAWIDSLSGFFLSHRKFASLLREMGGLKEDSAMMRLVARLNHCGDRETYMQQEAGRKLVALLDSIKHTKLTSQVYITNLGQKMSRAGMIAVALNSGNKINKERLSTNINEVAQAEILGKLTKEELNFVQGVWDMLESYWPEMEALEKRTNGISPRKVEAEPLKVHTVDGFDVELTGGYYPIVYDPGKSVVSAEQQIKDLGADMIRGSNQSSSTKQGHLKSRSEKVNRNLLLDLSVISRHLQQVTHDICFREWVQETNRIFRNKDFKDAVTENFGVQFYRALSDHLVAIAGGGSAMVNPALEGIAGRAGNFLKGNVSFNAMALSITTAALQPLGITQSIQRLGAKWVFAAGLKMAVNPYAAFKECHEKSLMMRMRADVMNADIADFNALSRKGKLGKVGRTYEKVAFAPMQYMQMLVDVPTWQAAYQKALAEGYEENRAVEMADQAVLDSQGGGHNKDRSLIHRNHPFATMFYSYFSSMENLWAESLSQQKMKTIKGQAGFLRDFTLLLAIPSLGQALIFSALRGDDWDKDPEEWLLWVMQNIGGTALGMIVYLRELSTIFSGFDYSGPPVARIINNALKAVKTLGSERAKTDSKVLGVLGIVALKIKRTVDYLSDSRSEKIPMTIGTSSTSLLTE